MKCLLFFMLLVAIVMVAAQRGNGGQYRPSRPGYEPVSIGPAFVTNNRPGKQYDNPYLRGGK